MVKLSILLTEGIANHVFHWSVNTSNCIYIEGYGLGLVVVKKESDTGALDFRLLYCTLLFPWEVSSFSFQ